MGPGYTGNLAYGVMTDWNKGHVYKDISIRNVRSATGDAVGIGLFPGVEVEFQGTISIEGLVAGYEVEVGTLAYEDRPNKAPEACAIKTISHYMDWDVPASYSLTNTEIPQSKCVTGHVYCEGSLTERTFVGVNNECEESDETILAKYTAKDIFPPTLSQKWQAIKEDTTVSSNNNANTITNPITWAIIATTGFGFFMRFFYFFLFFVFFVFADAYV